MGAEEKAVILHFDERSDNWGEVSLLDQTSPSTEEVPLRRLDTLWKQWGQPSGLGQEGRGMKAEG